MTQPTLRWGSTGPAVQRLHQALAAAGRDPGANDGRFGGDTYRALVAFQGDHGLPVDGIAGPLTWSLLERAEAPTGPRGVSLHIGVNSVDPAHYGSPATLHGCENDARAMEALAKARGFETSTLLTAGATTDAVLAAFARAAAELTPEDILLVTYAGHGAQVRDLNGDDGDDGLDETWCLHDRMLLDDELYSAWGAFAAGVRIVLLSDSCHSGTVSREVGDRMADVEKGYYAASVTRDLPRETVDQILAAHEADYRSRATGGGSVQATVITISGCQDNQLSQESGGRGRFSTTLEQVWANGSFAGDYRALHREIVARMVPNQTPNYTVVGAANPQFEAEQPFTIAAPQVLAAAA